MAVARRPLLTAIAAASLLAALWFVPSADATDEPVDTARAQDGRAVTVRAPEAASGPSGTGTGIAAGAWTGIDTTPYLIGGVTALGIGAAFARSSRGASAALRG
ncbi:hypothetical protein ACFU6R_33845 [Streptomyces sp. NPDC057499]|uniref:hypothetical protein n=1 Tax=Streptomyces sp. NPDC057499 TaxID=3346150 RepID=UPI0036C72FA5